ncbi:MAG: hypothetical protein Q4G51_00440 [Dermatophilus congolensis]|nr:hypothetical protein [Dermatophilus congolensis]
MTTHRPELVATELVAVIIAMRSGEPHVLTVGRPGGVAALPAGPLRSEHRSLQSGLRAWVQQLTGHTLGFAEQLYTFADRERLGSHQRIISVSYLGLAGGTTAADAVAPSEGANWRAVYDFFPTEDRRSDTDEALAEIVARLRAWAGEAPVITESRLARVDAAFGLSPELTDANWAPEGTLTRYELMWEAGLVDESRHDTEAPGRGGHTLAPITGESMLHDHRRILATGLSRLRTTLQYRPVVFELMPDEFTLRDLQDCVEAVCGTRLHTQNFRRLVLGQDLVEPTGGHESKTGGRPARLFHFRREVVGTRPVGLALPRSR